MDYSGYAAKVVGGGTVALAAKAVFEGTPDATGALVFGSVFVVAAFVAVYGLFEGIEAAVEAGRERASEE